MGSSKSKPKEDDRNAVGARMGSTYIDQAREAASMIGTDPSLASKIHLSISCQGLRNMDTDSLSDAFVVVFTRSGGAQAWEEIGRTEIVGNNLDPKWVTIIQIEYRFEQVQHLRLEVYDAAGNFSSNDASHLPIGKQNYIGGAECALASVVGARGSLWQANLDSPYPDQKATIRVKAEEAPNQHTMVNVALRAADLPKPKGGKACPFLIVSRLAEDGSAIPCYKTEVHMKTNCPIFAPIDSPLSVLANGDVHRPLLIDVMSWKANGRHEKLGSAKASVDDMMKLAQQTGKPLKLNGKSGQIVVTSCSARTEPSFFDFIAGGVELQFIVAVDYTASNGNPKNPTSLHYQDPSRRTDNQYVQAIKGVGEVIEFYDHDKCFPVYGFGGKPHPNQPVLHCFAVNGNESNPEVEGVNGIIDLYTQSLDRVSLSGPTLFGPVINQAANIARETLSHNPADMKYWILLILTDGLINDMDNTIDAIVAAADLPFSIIIVGVGQEDFSNMDILDGDDDRLKNGDGKLASRDIVQFVPIREYLARGPQALAAEVLEEVPGQLLEYMKQRNLTPAAPRRGSHGQSVRDVMHERQASFKMNQERRASATNLNSRQHGGQPSAPPPTAYSYKHID